MQQEELKGEQRVLGVADEEVKAAYNRTQCQGRTGLTQKQAMEALKLLGMTKNILEVGKFWSDIEKNDSELLSLDEFVQLYTCKECEPVQLMMWAFNKFDANNDGIIDLPELRKTLTAVYGEDFVDDDFVEGVFALSDANGDGVLQIEEFIDMMMERSGSLSS